MLKNYILGVAFMFISGYIYQHIHLYTHPYKDLSGEEERPPRYWGPFSQGEIVSWIIRSLCMPLILPFFASNLSDNEIILKVVIAIHLILWAGIVPIIVERIIDKE